MSQCVARRWAGKGTTTEKPTDPVLAKEMNDRLKDIQNARTQMDSMWTVKEENAIIVSEKKDNRIAVPIFNKTSTRGF
jgi:hypothetical protein